MSFEPGITSAHYRAVHTRRTIVVALIIGAIILALKLVWGVVA